MKPKTIPKREYKTIQLIIAIIALVLIVSACTATADNNTANNAPAGVNTAPTNTNTNTANNPPQANTPNTATTTNAGKIKLSESRYADSAFLISGDTLDANAQAAMSGFSMQKTTNADGTITIALTSTNPEYQNQSYTLQTGQKLYFIETRMGDDGNNEEFNLGDDKAVVVDADGYIVQ